MEIRDILRTHDRPRARTTPTGLYRKLLVGARVHKPPQTKPSPERLVAALADAKRLAAMFEEPGGGSAWLQMCNVMLPVYATVEVRGTGGMVLGPGSGELVKVSELGLPAAAEWFSAPPQTSEQDYAELSRKLQDCEERSNRLDIESSLSQASSRRLLAAALMDGEWLGLEVLCAVRELGSTTFSSLLQRIGKDSDLVAPALARLVQCGVLTTQGSWVTCTDEGRRIVERVETLGS